MREPSRERAELDGAQQSLQEQQHRLGGLGGELGSPRPSGLAGGRIPLGSSSLAGRRTHPIDGAEGLPCSPSLISTPFPAIPSAARPESDPLDLNDFLARFMAFRQHVEVLLLHLRTKTAKKQPWRVEVRRDTLVADVVQHFSHGFSKTKLFQSSVVTFIDAHGAQEEGYDQGGLTVELYSNFFRQVLAQPLGVFEGVPSDNLTTASVGLLPAASAPAETLVAVGRAMCKCIMDDQPLGRGLGRFLFEFISDAHERRVFKTPERALAALADFDPDLTQRWGQLLKEPQPGLPLHLFDPEAVGGDTELPASHEAMASAVIAGCRHKLLGCRERSLRALRDGFIEHVDLRIQLGALSSTELLLMVRGYVELSAMDLLNCFNWPKHASPPLMEQALFLQQIILDESPELALSSEQRLHVLEWATALTALPCNGLAVPISLKLLEGASVDMLPAVHTCTHEVHVPAYHSREQLRDKLLKAVEHRHDGFQIQ